MNRRRLLAMLPLAPAVLVVSAVVPVEAAPELIDTRFTFKLSDYQIYDPDTSYVCEAHNVDHRSWTHGCQPIAFPKDRTLLGFGNPRPATADAIPDDVMSACPFSSDLSGPHQHHDFRWVD